MSDSVVNNEIVTIRTRDGINLAGVPKSLLETDEEFLKAYVQQLRDTSGPGEYTFKGMPASESSYLHPSKTYEPKSSPPDLVDRMAIRDRAGVAGPPLPPGYTPPQETGPQETGPQETGPRTDLAGLMGGVVRGAGPTAMGAATGAAIGAPFAGVGAVPGAAIGAMAGGLTQIAGDPIVSLVNRVLGTNYTLPTVALSDLFTKLGVAEPDTAAERIVQATAQGVAGAGGSVALGQTMQAGQGLTQTMKGTIGGMLADSPVAQYGGGAGSAAASQGAEELGAGPIAQLGAGLAGGVVGAGLSNINLVRSTKPPIEEAASAGVRVMTSDVRPPNTFVGKWIRNLGERIPIVGTGTLRSAQQAERAAAVRSIIRQYGADDVANLADDIVDDLLTTRRSRLSQFTGAKEEVIEAMTDTDIAVGVQRTLDAIDVQVTQLKSLNTREVQPVISRLEDWAVAIQNQDLANIEVLRRQLGESFSAPSLVGVRSVSERALTNIYGPLRQDMTDYIKEFGTERLLTKWVTANNRLSEMAEEMAVPALKRVLNRGDATPEVVNNLLFSRNRSDVARMYRELTPDGRATARTAIIARAAERAGGEIPDPDIFVREVKRLGDQVGVFFNDGDARQLEGLMRVLEITSRAASASKGPSSIAMGVVPLSAAGIASYFGGGVKGFGLAIGGGAAYGLAARAYESVPVRNILMALPRVAQGSTQEAALLRRLFDTIRAVEATQEAPERPERVNEEEAQLIRG